MSGSTYHPHIDGLRAIAVLSVLIFHLEPAWLPGGYTGVDVFFVISGFVISGSLDNRELQSLSQFFGYFYSKRLKRILPALLVCVLVTTVFTVLFTIRGNGETSSFSETAMYSLVGFSNLILYESAQSYFAQSTELNPFTHTWSLAVEEQFYFVFPLLFFPWANACRLGRSKEISIGLFVAGAVLSLCFAVWSSRSDPSFAFYSIFSRFWELAVGVLLYQYFSVRSSNVGGPPQYRSFGMALSVLLLVVGLWFSDEKHFPIPWVILPVFGTAGLIVFLLVPPERGFGRAIYRLLTSQPMTYVGRLSYSLYLWHWPVIVIAKWTFGVDTAQGKFAVVAVVTLLTLMSYYLIERPARNFHPNWAKSDRWPLYLSAASIVLGILFVSALFRVQDRVSLSVTSDRNDWYPSSKVLDLENSCGSQSVQREFPFGAHLEIRSGCRSANNQRLFVLGDSHVWAYLPMLRTLAANQPIDVLTFSMGGCLVPEAAHFPDSYTTECREFSKQAMSRTLELLEKGDVVFFPGSRISALSAELRSVADSDAKNSAKQPAGVLSVEQLQQSLAPYILRSALVVLEQPKPVFGAEAYRCADWFNRANVICKPGSEVERGRVESAGLPVVAVYEAIAATNPDVSVFNALDSLCTSSTCSAFKSGRPVIYDLNHLSRFGNQVLYPQFSELITTLQTRSQARGEVGP